MTIQKNLPQLSHQRLATPTPPSAQTPPTSMDHVEISSPKNAKEAEGKKLRHLAKPFAILGGVAGAAGVAAMGALGGAVGALVGSGACIVLGIAGVVGGGALGGIAAADYCEKKNIISAPGLFLVLGGVCAGAMLGGGVGFYGGGAIGAVAGAQGGILGATVGAVSGAPIGAAAGGIARAGVELARHPEQYPETLKGLHK